MTHARWNSKFNKVIRHCARAWSPRTFYFAFVRSTGDRGKTLIHTAMYNCDVKYTTILVIRNKNFKRRMALWTYRIIQLWFISCMGQLFSSNDMLAKLTQEQCPLVSVFTHFVAISLMFGLWFSCDISETYNIEHSMMWWNLNDICLGEQKIFIRMWQMSW